MSTDGVRYSILAPALAMGMNLMSALNVWSNTRTIVLPEPRQESSVSVEEALRARRSEREYLDAPLTLAEVSQLLWAAQGVTHPEGMRTAPSAGATYPLEVYLVAETVTGLPMGVYKYLPQRHALRKVAEGAKRDGLARAALDQIWVRNAPASLIFAAVYERTTARYGQRGVRYVHMEVGHAAENVHLQAVALGLGTVVVGAFRDEEVRQVIAMEDDEQPLCIMPIGRIR